MVACKSASGVTVVKTMALVELPSLFVGTGSKSIEPLETLLVNVTAPVGAVTVSVRLLTALLVREGIVQVTNPLVVAIPFPVALTNVTPVGRVSVILILEAVEGPRFVSVMV